MQQIGNPNQAQTPLQASMIQMQIQPQNQSQNQLQIQTQIQSQLPNQVQTQSQSSDQIPQLQNQFSNQPQLQIQTQIQSQIPNQIQTQLQNPDQIPQIQIQSQNQNQIQTQIPQNQNQLPNQFQIQSQLDSTPVQSLLNNSTQIDTNLESNLQNSPVTTILNQRLGEIVSEEVLPLQNNLKTESTTQPQSTFENRISNSIELNLDQIILRSDRSRNFQSQNQNFSSQSDLPRNPRQTILQIQDQPTESTSNRFDQPIQTVTLDRTTQTIEQPQQIDQPQAPQSTQDPYNIREQIVQNARLLQRQGTTEMVIQLRPEHLGEMTLKVSVSAEGSVTASFHSDNVAVRTIIENTLVQLKNDLANQGIRVDNIEVSAQLGDEFLQQGGQNPSAWENQNQSQAAQLRPINLEDLDEGEVVSAYNSSADLSPVSGQNLSSDGGVNYLV